MSTPEPRPHRWWWWAVLADLVCVVALAAGGHNAHEPDADLSVVLEIGWPFALAAAGGHAVLVLAGRRADRVWPDGVVALLVTYGAGMVLRASSGRGTATAFLLVAFGVLAASMLGWRLLAAAIGHRRRRSLA